MIFDVGDYGFDFDKSIFFFILKNKIILISYYFKIEKINMSTSLSASVNKRLKRDIKIDTFADHRLKLNNSSQIKSQRSHVKSNHYKCKKLIIFEYFVSVWQKI